MGHCLRSSPQSVDGCRDGFFHFRNLRAHLVLQVGGTGIERCETSIVGIEATDELTTDLRERVESVIKVIQPAIQADDGDIVLIDVDETSGEVVVELVGACVSCPASDQTLKAGIERILVDRVPGVTGVRNVGETLEAQGTSVSL